MWYFLGGIFLLIAGYFVYGRIVERIVGVDDRSTPALSRPDGVDYVPLPQWKNMLIQLLNIAGIGPVIGVILGIKFGSVVFLIIPVGNIIGGAVHDFIVGVMSMRQDGANITGIIRNTLGRPFFVLLSFFTCFLLLLLVTVFINIPAQLVDSLIPGAPCFWYVAAVIFIYYIIATFFPVDKIIGNLYPLFGGLLILGSLAIFAVLLIKGFSGTVLLEETDGFRAKMFSAPQTPIIPMLFVTIACGILSGFHSTQSPIVARTLTSERQARRVFYGMMVAEGIIAMIWAGAAMALFNKFPEYMGKNPAEALTAITENFLYKWGGVITVISVIVLAVTSGDTAMRSLRLSFAEIFKVEQKTVAKRILVCLPIIGMVCLLLAWSNSSAESFNLLWNYSAWGNQVVGAAALMAGTVWLFSCRRQGWITLVPGMFMTFIVLCYILWLAPGRGSGSDNAIGFGLDLDIAMIISGILAVIAGVAAVITGRRRAGKI